jgi:hypothetical protein
MTMIRPKALQQERPVLRPEETTMVDAAEARTKSMKGKRETGAQDKSRAAARAMGQPREDPISCRPCQETPVHANDRGGKPIATKP